MSSCSRLRGGLGRGCGKGTERVDVRPSKYVLKRIAAGLSDYTLLEYSLWTVPLCTPLTGVAMLLFFSLTHSLSLRILSTSSEIVQYYVCTEY